MQAQAVLRTPEKLHVKEKALKSEALKRGRSGSAEAQEAMQRCCLPAWHAHACVFPLVARTPLSGTAQATS